MAATVGNVDRHFGTTAAGKAGAAAAAHRMPRRPAAHAAAAAGSPPPPHLRLLEQRRVGGARPQALGHRAQAPHRRRRGRQQPRAKAHAAGRGGQGRDARGQAEQRGGLGEVSRRHARGHKAEGGHQGAHAEARVAADPVPAGAACRMQQGAAGSAGRAHFHHIGQPAPTTCHARADLEQRRAALPRSP